MAETSYELRKAAYDAETECATWSRRAQRFAFRGKLDEARAASLKADACAEKANDLQIRAARLDPPARQED